MTKSKRHSQVLRSYWGEDTASTLIDWLNRVPRLKNDPVRTLIDLQLRGPAFPDMDPRPAIVRHVNETARRWRLALVPIAAMTPTGWDADWRHKPTNKAHPLQLLAFVKALHLASQGLLNRVRPCGSQQCEKFFFARFAHQEFCSAECQRLHLRSTPAWRKGRADYMRRLRAGIKQREERALKIVKKGKKR
jgi:hypothetical protein